MLWRMSDPRKPRQQSLVDERSVAALPGPAGARRPAQSGASGQR